MDMNMNIDYVHCVYIHASVLVQICILVHVHVCCFSSFNAF
jgi:hypothetical protein